MEGEELVVMEPPQGAEHIPADADELDEDELLLALEQESDDEGAVAAVRHTLAALGDDLLLRILGLLSVAQLCTLSGVLLALAHGGLS